MKFDQFDKLKGNLVQSGQNASTYSPFNNPESDDPVAISLRGHMFLNSSHFMKADEIFFNHSFTISMWVYATDERIIICEKLYFGSDSSLTIELSNIETSSYFTFNPECITSTWTFKAFSVYFFQNATHLEFICDHILKTKFTFLT